MPPTYRQNLYSRITRTIIGIGVQRLQVFRVRIDTLQGLTEHVHIVNKIHTLHSKGMDVSMGGFLALEEGCALTSYLSTDQYHGSPRQDAQYHDLAFRHLDQCNHPEFLALRVV